MSSRRGRSKTALTVQAAEVALAAPAVVAHRVARMALAGSRPSSRDRHEFHLMTAEKVLAFYESWNAMALETLRTSGNFGFLMADAFLRHWSSGARPSVGAASRLMHRAARDVLGAGFAPVHRRVVANAKRLRRARSR